LWATCHADEVNSPASGRFRLRVSLFESDPEIWRLLEVDGALRLDELHEVIQIALGWRNSHLHQFLSVNPHERATATDALRWTMDDPDGILDDPGLRESEWTITRVFDQIAGPLYYEYDFGDSWLHTIELVERIADAAAPRAQLLRGGRRGPFEDSGGVAGYERMLELLSDPAHPDHDGGRRWVTAVIGPWPDADPDAVDVEHINRELVLRFPSETDAVRVPHAIDTVLERLPVPLERELRGYARRLRALDEPTVTGDLARKVVEPYAWLLRRIGTDGLQLTQAGWLPPAVVTEAVQELGWQDRWIGKLNREDQTPPIADLRANAQQFGLVRKLKGRLVLSSTAKRLLDDPIALWESLARAVALRHRTELAQDLTLLLAVEVASGRHNERAQYAEPITFGLDALGWVRGDNRPLTVDDVLPRLLDGWRVLESLNVFERAGWQTGPPTEAGRAFARAVVLA